MVQYLFDTLHGERNTPHLLNFNASRNVQRVLATATGNVRLQKILALSLGRICK